MKGGVEKMEKKIEKKEVKQIEDKKEIKIGFDFENYILIPGLSGQLPIKKDIKK